MVNKILKKYVRISEIVSKALIPFFIIAILFILGITTSEVIWRGLTGESVPDSISLATIWMPVTAYTALALAQRRKKNVTVNVLFEKFPDRLKKTSLLLGMVLGLILSLLEFKVGLGEFIRSVKITEYYSGSFIRLPSWPAKIFVPLGFGGLALQFIADIISLIFGFDTLEHLEYQEDGLEELGE